MELIAKDVLAGQPYVDNIRCRTVSTSSAMTSCVKSRKKRDKRSWRFISKCDNDNCLILLLRSRSKKDLHKGTAVTAVV